MVLELSEEQENTLTAFLDSKERDELINTWLKDFGFSPLKSRLMAKILLPLLFKYLGKAGKEGVAWLDEKLKNQFPFYQQLSTNLTRKILFKIECNDAKADQLNQRLQIPNNVDPKDWAALDEQTQVWIGQLNKLDLIIWSLGDLKASIKLHLDQPRININALPSRLLRPHNAFIPLTGRNHEMNQLVAWCNAEQTFSWQIIIGEGGMGKTRLAQEFAKEIGETGWHSGFLDQDLLESLVKHDQFHHWAPLTDTLIIIDYAATKLGSLKKLIQQCARLAHDVTDQSAPVKLRLLLLERHADKDQGWLKEILAAGEGALHDDINDAQQLMVKLQPPSQKISHETIKEVLQATLDSWGTLHNKEAPELPPLTDTDLQQLQDNTGARPLYLQMAALHCCEIGSAKELLYWDRAKLLQVAVERERYYINKLCAATDKPTTLVERLAALLFFAGKISTQHEGLFEVIEKEATICGYPQVAPAEIVSTLSQFLGDDNSNGAMPMLNPIQPDLIGAAFTATILQQSPHIQVTLKHAIALGNETAWANLLRSAQDLYAVDMTEVEAWLPPMLIGRPKNELWRIAGLLPKQSVALRKFSVDLYEALLGQSKKDNLEVQALILNNLSNSYYKLDRLEKALEAAKRANEIYKYLAQRKPDALKPDLAMSFNNLGNRYGDLGRYQDALVATLGAIKLYMSLVKKNVEIFEPDLAMSFNNLGTIYSQLGRRKEALAVTLRAVEIRERLAQKDPDNFDSDLAESLSNAGQLYTDTGQFELALDNAVRATEIFYRLANKMPDAFEPHLALSLNNLSVRYCDLGEGKDALKAAKSAVKVYEYLEQRMPGVFKADFARSLNTLGSCYSILENYSAALNSTMRAFKMYDCLAQKRPDVFEPNLAMSLSNLGCIYGALNRYQEAVAVTKESIVINERLAQIEPAVFKPELARCLRNQGSHYERLKKYEAASEATTNAITLYKDLVGTEPGIFESDLAESLGNAGFICLKVNNPDQALELFGQGIHILIHKFLETPTAFKRSIINLRAGYLKSCEQSGKEPDMALLTPIADQLQALDQD